MWRPSHLGEVFAERHLTFRRPKGRTNLLVVRIGRPVRAPGANTGEPWWCPFVIAGTRAALDSVAGEDSLQALVLALRYVESLLLHKARRARASVSWIDDEQSPIFGSTSLLRLYSETNHALFKGIERAVLTLESARDCESARQAAAKHLRKVVKATRFEAKRRWT